MHSNNLLDGETLCKECGLCCMGVFHTHALLYTQNDLEIANKAQIPVLYRKEKELPYFNLPCPSFNGLCSIYQERPSVCSQHKCALLKNVIATNTSLGNSLAKVRSIKDILNNLLPELKKYTHMKDSNDPKYLMEKIWYNLKSTETKKEFKKENNQLVLNYTMFTFLKEKYFYPKDIINKK